MTGSTTRVGTVWPRTHTGLLAHRLTHTVATVTDTPTPVHLTLKSFVTRQTTGDVLEVARDVAALLMIPHAPFLREVSAGRTLLFTVAVVKHRMVTLMPPGAEVFTFWRFCPTGDGRVQHRQPTVTRQLVKAGLPAGFTVATVTGLLAAVEATVQLVATNQGALVLSGHAAQLSTLVSATQALLVTAPLTSEHQLIFFEYRCTGNLL